MRWWQNITIILIALSAVFVSAAEVATDAAVVAQLTESDAPTLVQPSANGSSATAAPGIQSEHAGKSKEQLLAELRDVYSPAAPAWWPPAPGWWIALLVLLLALVIGVQWLRRRLGFRRENDWKKTANLLYKQLCDQALDTSVPGTSIIAEASVLMRRVALTQLPRQQTASLTDDQWLAALDKIGHTNEYKQGAGRLLTRHPYMRPQDIDRAELDALLKLIKSTIDGAPNTLIVEDSHQYRGGSLGRESGVV